jgi:hypothetical protein
VPASYHIDPAARIVYCRVWGVLTEAELIDHYKQLAADPAFRSSFRQFGDIREATEILVSGGGMLATARARVFDPGVRRALIAQNDLQFGMARMFAIYAEAAKQDIRVFRGADEARRWIEAEPAPDGGVRAET